MVLEPEQLRGDPLVAAVRGAHGPHDLRSALHAEDAAARNAALDDRRHVLALGREGQPVHDLRPGPQRFVIFAPAAQPFEQRTLGRIADDMPSGIEERRGVERHDLGEIPFRQVVVTHQLLHVHPVLREGSGLVGADHRHRPHRLAGVHLAHEVVGPEHPPHGHGQRQRDRHGQSLGNGHHDDGHRNHEDMEHLLRNGQPVLFEQVAQKERLAQHDAEDQNRKRDAHPADELREPRQLPVERRLLVVLHGGLLRDAPRLRGVAHGRDDHHAVTVRDGRAAHHDIRRIGGLRIEMRLVHGLVHLGFARQGRFVDLQRHGLHQLAVGGDRLAALDVNHVAHDHLAARNLADRTVAHHLHRHVVIDPVEPPETPLGVPLEPESDAGGQNDGADNADRLGEVLVHESDGERQHGRQQQDANDRIAEFLGEQPPGRIVLRRRDDVVAVPFAALGDLSGSQSFGIVTDHFSGQILFMENCRVEASSRTAINNRIVKAMSDEPP